MWRSRCLRSGNSKRRVLKKVLEFKIKIWLVGSDLCCRSWNVSTQQATTCLESHPYKNQLLDLFVLLFVFIIGLMLWFFGRGIIGETPTIKKWQDLFFCSAGYFAGCPLSEVSVSGSYNFVETNISCGQGSVNSCVKVSNVTNLNGLMGFFKVASNSSTYCSTVPGLVVSFDDPCDREVTSTAFAPRGFLSSILVYELSSSQVLMVNNGMLPLVNSRISDWNDYSEVMFGQISTQASSTEYSLSIWQLGGIAFGIWGIISLFVGMFSCVCTPSHLVYKLTPKSCERLFFDV